MCSIIEHILALCWSSDLFSEVSLAEQHSSLTATLVIARLKPQSDQASYDTHTCLVFSVKLPSGFADLMYFLSPSLRFQSTWNRVLQAANLPL